MQVQIKLTVLFDGMFWVGIFERIYDEKLEVAKVTFITEPSEAEIYNYILYNYQNLKFSLPVLAKSQSSNANPKRMKRIVKKQLNSSIGTKSQQALKKQQEIKKSDYKTALRLKKEMTLKMKFEMKQKKRRQKHKGR